MSDLMSLTQITLADVKLALANQQAAKARLKQAVELATPKYKETLKLRWWNVFAKRMTSKQLLTEASHRFWYGPEEILYQAGLITDDEYAGAASDYSVMRTVKILAQSERQTFHVNEDVLRFINKWTINATN